MLELFISLKLPLIILQIIVSPILVGLILLQSGKEDDLGSALGGAGGGNTVLGTGGTSKVLVRFTAIFAIIFMLNSILLAKIYKEETSESVTSSVSEPLVPAQSPVNALVPGKSEPAKTNAEKPTTPTQKAAPAPKTAAPKTGK